MSIVDLNTARVEREQDNKKVSVEELLRLALDDVVKGEIKKPLCAFICIVDEGDGDNPPWTLQGYRCQLSRHEEIGLIEVFKAQQIGKWFAE